MMADSIDILQRKAKLTVRVMALAFCAGTLVSVPTQARSLFHFDSGTEARTQDVESRPQSLAQAVLNYHDRGSIFESQQASLGMVASDHVLASQAGSDILAQGGNAVDAAVATAFALAVVLPYAGNLGGGGFALLHEVDSGKTRALDFRETAPAAADEDMFLGTDGEPVPRMSIESTASIGVPGSVAGLLALLDEAGSFSREDVIAPAIALAQEGFEVTPTLARLLNSHAEHLYKSAANRVVFFHKGDTEDDCEPVACPREALQPLQIGQQLVQPDLARTLRFIAREGASAFYEGSVARSLVETIHADKGKMTLDDLKSYEPLWREPIEGRYRDLEIYSMPAPSSGGIHLVQMLNMLGYYPLDHMGFGSAASLQLLTEVARRAYADRAQYLGDPDYVHVPVEWLLSSDYAVERAQEISLTRATPSDSVFAGEAPTKEGTETTHLSVVDAKGNLVSLTTTLNLNFGSGWMADGTGILLNNEMDDFSIKPGVPNAYGLVGSHANRIEAGKRPLSSMAPTIALRDGKPWLATGSPGGARIITIVMQVLVNMTDHGMNLASAVAAPRMHHQWKPDVLWLEAGYSPDTIGLLQAMGQNVEASRPAGRVQSVMFEAPLALGYSDPRSGDGAAIGPDRLIGQDNQ